MIPAYGASWVAPVRTVGQALSPARRTPGTQPHLDRLFDNDREVRE
jgi:hypothetical protein